MNAVERNAVVTKLADLNLGAAYEEVAFNIQLADVLSRLTDVEVTALIDRAKKITALIPEGATREDIAAIRDSFTGLYPRRRPGPPIRPLG